MLLITVIMYGMLGLSVFTTRKGTKAVTPDAYWKHLMAYYIL